MKALARAAQSDGCSECCRHGLSLAVEFAEAGLRVIAIDVDTRKVESLIRGESYIEDVPINPLKPLVESEKFCATADYADLREADAIRICVSTLLRKTKDPMSYIVQAIDAIAEIAHAGMLVVLESTAVNIALVNEMALMCYCSVG
jgi:UDP-N-acetyl-D-glucosamine dehydrogenase